MLGQTVPNLPVADLQRGEVFKQLRLYCLPVHFLWMAAYRLPQGTITELLNLYREIYTSKLPGLA